MLNESFSELGYTSFEARNDVVFVRTDKIASQSSGGILFTEKSQDFYNGLAIPKGKAPKIYWGSVLAIGEKTEDINVGDHVCFMRADFAWSDVFEDKTRLGWVRGEHILLVEE